MNRIAKLLGIEAMLDRRPSSLSGGEKQRVAIGRTLLSRPRMLLMDEPLSAWTKHAKPNPALSGKASRRPETAILYVSHSVSEVARLADHVVALDGGKVAATGPHRICWVQRRVPTLMRPEVFYPAGPVGRDTGWGGPYHPERLCADRTARSLQEVSHCAYISRHAKFCWQRPGRKNIRTQYSGRRDTGYAPDSRSSVELSLQCGQELLRSRITNLSRARDLGLRSA